MLAIYNEVDSVRNASYILLLYLTSTTNPLLACQ